ncbi:small subunit processome component 20 homolog [Mizuhopecten yessoensis]|uniref:small subunit processome component 20 homolog n=1 Tax=Mizuhopecten yessoensis TaxID=6573 RepID=UPI000B458823|nr:small subunit processome component 20 homolog [Mizuhopecten yessoensis]
MGKSSYHRSENTFRFQTFSERISDINIDVIHKIRHHDDTPGEHSTYFGEALEKWLELNQTAHFIEFRKEISEQVQSFTQLVHNEAQIVAALKKHLMIPKTLAYEPMLDLLVQLARDFQHDFYKHFPDFFTLLVELLNRNTQDTDLMEKLFSALSYIFKFLWRYLLKDMETVYGFYSSLLSEENKQYIRQFAAESFAFLMRKVKDHGKLFDFLFKSLSQSPEKADGLGRLMFEMLKGVKRQLHSCTIKIFPILLSKLGHCQQEKKVKPLPWQLVEECMAQCFRSMAENIDKANFEDAWTIFLTSVTSVHQSWLDPQCPDKAKAAKHVARLLRLAQIWLNHWKGAIIRCHDPIATTLLPMLKGACLPVSVGEELVSTVAAFLLHGHSQTAIANTAKLVSAVFKTSYPMEMLFKFATVMLKSKLPIFEKDVLMSLNGYCLKIVESGKEEGREQVLSLYTQILLHKTTLPSKEEDLKNLHVYPLDFGLSGRSKFMEFLTSTIDGAGIKTWTMKEHRSLVWSAVLCLPHVWPVDNTRDTRINSLTKLMGKVVTQIKKTLDETSTDQLLFLYYSIIVSLTYLHGDDDLCDKIPVSQITELLKSHSTNIHMLTSANLYLMKASADTHATVLEEDVLLDVFPCLQDNLTSWNAHIRTISLRILTHFTVRLPFVEGFEADRDNVFETCLKAELVPLTVQDYRQRQLFLQRLDFSCVQNSVPAGPFREVAVRYLIGSIFVNFKLLWEPTRKLIASHAKGLGNKGFWELFNSELMRAAAKTEELLTGIEKPYLHGNNALISMSDFDVSEVIPSHMTTERVDYYNFRDQLWKAMILFSDQCEAKSRDLSPLLLRFIRNEYYPSDMSMAPKQNICRRIRGGKPDQEEAEGEGQDIEEQEEGGKQNSQEHEEEMDIPEKPSSPLIRVTRSRAKGLGQERSRSESSEQSEDHQTKGDNDKTTLEKKGNDRLQETEDDATVDDSVEESEVQVSKRQRRAATSTLVIHLELFAKFKNPKSLYLEPDINTLYMELLVHKDPVVQKTTFDCIMAYKHNYLTQYRENFNRLLDDTTFKSELVLFSIDHDGGQINIEYRSQLMPILMRILYGKMLTKTGKETAGRSHSNLRQSIVLRFLNGCSMGEVVNFLDMVFMPFKHFITDDPQQMALEVMRTTDPSEVIPLRKITGTLYSINTFYKKLGHLLDDYLPSLIKILVGLMATCVACLEHRDNITPFSLSMLKTLRQMATTRFIELFENYDGYKPSPVEIDAVFTVIVWPQLEKLPFEGVYHPTTLLKILATWSRSPRYIMYLSKHHHDDKEITPLPFVFKLLNATNVRSTVSSLILEIVDNLLNPKKTEDDAEELRPLPVHCGSALDYTHMTIQEIGINLMSPHIPAVLTFLQTAIASRETKVYIKKGSSRELRILSSISCFVSDMAQCPVLISLLLPYLDKVIARSKEAEEDILTSISNLMAIITNKSQFFRRVSVLFSNILYRKSRDLLCSILKMILTEESDQSSLAELILELNAWDPKRTEDPDYTKRLSAFRNANEMIKAMKTIEADVLLPIMHNACYFINMIDDLSIRDNATNTLVTMVTQFGLATYDNDTFRDLITQGILVEIKAGFRNKNENVRHEYIALLSVVVDTFPDQPNLADLRGLKDKDLEADFFENIRHIQTHKRSRALRRLIKYMSGHRACKEAIMSYFLPLASAFLQIDSYTKAQALQEAAIDTIGAVCLQLPWQQYLHQLKFYLGRLQKDLDKQKGLIRVIVAILDSFHFDVSASQLNLTHLPAAIAKKKAIGLPTEENEELKPEPDSNANDEEKTTDDMDVKEVLESDEVMETKQDMVLSSSGKLMCPPGLATKIHTTIVKGLLPQLQKCLTQRVRSEEEHKLARNSYADDTEILRVPLALAMVKLLQTLPKGSLERSLPGILIKVCNFLKSRAKDIRDTARDTLTKILTSLGSRFLPYALSEMRGILTRGYQLHVLTFTVYVLLRNMMPLTKTGDLDICCRSLQEVFHKELFGEVAEEKDVEGIRVKLFEARKVKSYDSYQILAKLLGTKSLIPFITPIKTILDTTRSHKLARKVQEVLKKVVNGLMENEGLTTEALTVFCHGLVSEAFPQLSTKQSESSTQNAPTPTDGRRKPESCLLLPTTPIRGGGKPKSSKRTNAHILVEFGVQLLHLSLKKGRLVATKQEDLRMLDPFVSIMSDCLQSQHIKVNTVSLRCLCWILRFPLPAIKKHIRPIANGIIVLLKNYASAGSATGDNLDLITMAFKAVTVLVRDVKCYEINSEQLQVLLGFCEEDLHDYHRQSTAFSLLRAILSRKLNVPEMQELMIKVQTMSITADSPHTRRECRQLSLQYMMDYPLGKKLVKHLEFFITQLSYETEPGRESALEMMASIFSSFPQTLLMRHAGFFFVPLSVAMVNDESLKCRKLTGLAIKLLLEKLDHNKRNELFLIALKWFQDQKSQHQSLGAQLCGLFVEVEAAQFERHLAEVFPVVKFHLQPSRYEKVQDESMEQNEDHLLFNILNLLLKVLRECNVVRTPKWHKQMNTIWEYTQKHLTHPHNWVRLAGAQMFGLLFASWQPEEIVEEVDEAVDYLRDDMKDKMELLAVTFVQQLQSKFLSDEMADQVIKNLIFISKVAKLVTLQSEEASEPEGTESQGKRLSLPWLVRKMAREANHESLNMNKLTIKRSSVFKWMAAVGLDLGAELLPSVAHIMMPPLQRETNDASGITDLAIKSLAQEVLDLLKKVLGVEQFTEIYARVLRKRMVVKETRKRQKAVEAVSNPEVAAKRKVKKNLAKREAKKRKAEGFRVSKIVKKRKRADVVIE